MRGSMCGSFDETLDHRDGYRSGRAPRRGRAVATLITGCALILGGCAVVDTTAEDGTHREGEAQARDQPHPVLSAAEIDAMRADPVPEPKTVEELLDLWSVPAEEPPDHDLWARLRHGFRLDAHEHPRVAAERRRFHARQQYFDMVAARAEPYLHYILEAIEARDLPTELVLVAVVESAFQPFAYSHGRAGGIWQFQPATARRFGLRQDWWYDGRRDVRASTAAALDYLEYLHGYFDGDWLLALAAYNAGEGRVQRAVRANAQAGEPTEFWYLRLPAETRTYVPRILALRDIFADPAAHGVTLREIPDEPALAVVDPGSQLDLALAADMADLPIEEIYRLNPGFNRWATHPDGPHELVVPTDRADALETALAERDPDELMRWRRHRIDPGETLEGIAGRYGTSVSLLRDINDVQGAYIRAGDHLLVPTAARPEAEYALSAANRERAIRSRNRPGRHRLNHSVEAGDTLWDIAREHHVGVRQLASWNGMAPGDTLRTGEELAVWVEGGAGGATGISEHQQLVNYRVRRGDSLSTIASRFNVSVRDIVNWNGIDSDSYLQPGQQLELHVDVREQAGAQQ